MTDSRNPSKCFSANIQQNRTARRPAFNKTKVAVMRQPLSGNDQINDLWVVPQKSAGERAAGSDRFKELYQRATCNNDADAKNELGMLHVHAGSVPGYIRAVELFRQAAEQNHVDAQCNLGMMYFFGRGVPRDYVRAVELYRRAAGKGYPRGQCNLAMMYGYGRGVSRDNITAVELYRKASEQGYALAQFKLGLMYKCGGGVPVDVSQAIKWFRKAAMQGHTPSIHYLAEMGEPFQPPNSELSFVRRFLGSLRNLQAMVKRITR